MSESFVVTLDLEIKAYIASFLWSTIDYHVYCLMNPGCFDNFTKLYLFVSGLLK